MMSKNLPSIFSKMKLSSGFSALRYAPGKLKITTYLPSCASIMRPENKDSREMVGEDASSLVM